ncbi:MAG: glycine cleavage system protein H [Pirellulaceae bacterium]|nr:glycine cleavage system protein H [Pirellulaceae bacterium]
MGEFTAEFPRDRHYAKNHMWASEISAQRWRFGLTAYAVRLLQDVYFLDWLVEPPTVIAARANIGSIESKKAESDLFAPIAGQFAGVNDEALSDPSIINADCYGDGWLIEIVADTTAVDGLLDPDGYAQHLVDAWDIAQKTIKGQANM